jgi:N-acetylneuraminic acid mutarotase
MGGNNVHPGMKVVPIGPTTPQRSLDLNEVYDPATNTWKKLQSMPTARNHIAMGAVNGKIYVIGGRVGGANLGTSSVTDLVEVYDPAADMWGVPGSKMPTARVGTGWTTYGGKIYMIGGEVYNTFIHAVVGAFEVYDPATNTWSIQQPIPVPRHGLNVAAVGNKLYVMGGHIAGGPDGGEEMNSNISNSMELP